MPLFFILSGVFFNSHDQFGKQLIKDFRRLLLPFILISIIQLTFGLIHSVLFHSGLFSRTCHSILYMSSPSWFLPALFMSRLLFCAIIKRTSYYLLYSLMISSISLLLTKYFSLNTLLAITSATGSVIFIALGYYAKEHRVIGKMQESPRKPFFLLFAIFLWTNTSIRGSIDMHINYYKLWVIDYIGACGGTYLFFNICQLIEKHLHIVKALLTFSGFYSLIILSFHSIEYLIFYFVQPWDNCYYVFLFRLLFSTISIYMTLNFKPLKQIFFPNTPQSS